MEIIIFIILLILAFVLFAKELFPPEISALFIVCLLVVFGLLNEKEALLGFANQSIILIGSLFVLIAGLKKTGLIKKLEDTIITISGKSRNLTFIFLLLLIALVSAFISNTATLAVAIPIIVSIAHKFNESPKQWLMPVAFASILGGMNTLVGTSTNIIISSLLPDYGLLEFSLFTTAKIALPILLVGILYLLFITKFVFKSDNVTEKQDLEVKYDLRAYTAELIVSEKSKLVNKQLSKTNIFREADITVLRILRKGFPPLFPRNSFIINADDKILVEGNLKQLTELSERYGLKFIDESKTLSNEQDEVNLELHEVLVMPNSLLSGKTPKEVYLRNRYRISLIAINRHGQTLRNELSEVKIQSGDILVVQFLNQVDNSLLDYLGALPMQKITKERYKPEHSKLALLIFFSVFLIGSTTSLSLTISCLIGAVLMCMLKILKINDVYQALDLKILIFIASVLALGKAMQNSGTDTLLANYLSDFLVQFDPIIGFAFFFLITTVMTSLLSNQATAVVMIPIAVSTANALGLPPMPFVMTVTIAASCCFVTPFEPALMLVYGAGEYKFKDFLRLGLMLNILAAIVAIFMITIYYT